MPPKRSSKMLSQAALDSAAELDRLADAMAQDDGPRIFFQDSVPDKYAVVPAGPIDCENRIALCHAACCRLNVVLSRQDIEEGIVSWDPLRPYVNAQDAEGYCAHLERPACRCSVYGNRPVPCRIYDCRHDTRIWIDFEKRIANPSLQELDRPPDQATRNTGPQS